ncbi:outer membrane protein assembly factor BamB family protein [Kribbella sp. NPDC002412]
MSYAQPPPPGPPPGYYGFPPPTQQKPKKTGGVVALVLILVVLLVGAAGALYYYRVPLGLAGTRLDNLDKELGYVLKERFPSNYIPKEGSDLLGARWWTDKLLVRELQGQLVGYDLAAGKQVYAVNVPDNHFCGSSKQQSAKGYVAVLQGTRKDGCRRLTVVDLASGKVVWSKELEPAAQERPSKGLLTDFPQYDHRPVILGERLYVPTNKGGHIFSLANGAVIQDPSPKAKCFSTHYDAIGAIGLAYRNCSRVGDEKRHLLGFDAAGKTLWQYNLPAEGKRQISLVGVLSVDPLLIRVLHPSGVKEVWRVDPRTGKHQEVVDLKVRTATDPCEPAGGDGLYDCSRHVVSDGTLYLQQRNGIEAYDVATGNALWRSEWNLTAKVTEPLGLDAEGHPLVYLLPTKDAPGALVRVDRKTGTMTALAKTPKVDKSLTRPGGTDIAQYPDLGTVDWHNGHLAFFRVQPTSRDAGYAATVVFK